MSLTHRMQVLVAEAQHRRLEQEAARTGRSMGALIREAIDRTYGPPADLRAAAAKDFLAAPPAPVVDWPEEKRLLRDGADP